MAFACIPNFLITRRRRRNPNGDQVAAVSDDDTSADFVTVKKPDGDSPIMYNWGEIEKLTQNFSCLIGSGGFSNVYLASFAGGTAAAVKVSCSGDYLSPLFNQELDIMLRLRHRSIVKLLGYSFDQGGALVMEYVPKGTLQDNLHGSQLPLLSWGERMAIAYQLAEAIDYLHEKCDLPIVHGDIKSSNLVLDANLNCKLCDFGSAKMGFSSAVVMQGQGRRRLVMTGSPGYTDPHYLRTGLASKKNDIYSYGVIVLELLTGREAFSEVKGEMLASIMGPMMMMMSREGEARGDVEVVAGMVDHRLGGEFDIEEAKAMFCLAGKCIDMSPAVRPNATQIVEMMKEYVESAVALSMCSSTSSSKDWSTSYERE